MTNTTPAAELRAAAAKLRPSSPAVEAHTVAVRVSPGVAAALADWLDETAENLDALPPGFTHSTALAVARALNGGPS